MCQFQQFRKMMKKGGALKTAKKQNIQVAVRVRPLNSAEIADNSRNIVALDYVSKCVTLKDRHNLRAYHPFDKIYGEKDSQATVYNDLIAPLVGEVLSGYNCTVFVYGQTGTGKTYTMEGRHDESGEHTWQSDPSSGVIPRALHHIFSELEKQEFEEYSVRVSYLELYNEELYDLLGASDLKNTRLRIFEDPMRKGSVVINGMEEVPVKNRDEVYKLLKRGAERRQTAATLMNMNSSRSHSVFTVTVVIRENSVNGEELLKQGKLHLVDLAGSENIGKSGAIDKRAREAGNINQSLLTLGRVITSLTTNAQHIPYRESKLTRILQDSLGGRTITTLIATLSPAQSNIEETVNTLEYALRAKNIKNHPEVNEKLSRRGLLKEYNEEIERLRKDLMAAREQNGVYLDAENYDEMVVQIQKQTERIETIEGELEAVVSKLQRAMADIDMMDEHYRKVYERNRKMHEKLEKRRAEVESLSRDLATTKHTLEATEFALAESQKYGEKSRSQNIELGETCTILSMHLDKTHDKIDSLKAMFAQNDKLYGDFAAERIHKIHELQGGLQNCQSTVQSVSKATITSIDSTASNVSRLCDSIRTFFTDTITCTESFVESMTNSLQDSCTKGLVDMETQAKLTEEISAKLQAQNQIAATQFKIVIEQTMRAFAEIEAQKDRFVQESQEARKQADNDRRTFMDEMAKRLSQQEELQRKWFEESMRMAADMRNLAENSNEEDRKLHEKISATGESFVNSIGQTISEVADKNTMQTRIGIDATQRIVELTDSLRISAKDSYNNSEAFWTNTRDQHIQSVKNISGTVVSNCDNSLSNEINTAVVESTATIKESAQRQESVVAESVVDAAQRLEETQNAIETFVHEKVQRPQASGMTPEKTKFPIAEEMPALDSADVLKESFYASRQDYKRRKSIRTRESLFESDVSLLSPSSLQRMKLLSEIDESDENAMESMTECETISAKPVESQMDTTNVSRRTRRRVLGSDN